MSPPVGLLDGVGAIVVDVEGTTTPIDFVHAVLFPFARERLARALARADADAEIAEARALLEKDWQRDRADDPELPAFGDGVAYAQRLMDADRKATGLKALQGLIWREGYASGALRAPIFPDVPPALARWRRAGIALAVFSSGSVLAQRLLFAHTEAGDLTGHFAAFFDTTTGPKQEPAAYAAIAAHLGRAPAGVLFLSDVPGELDAARDAGLGTALVVRPGNVPVKTPSHPSVERFTAL